MELKRTYPFIICFNLALIVPTNVYAEIKDSNTLIERICLSSFNLEMVAAKIEIPEGMADFTCDCFISALSDGYSVSTAKLQCKEKAANAFKAH